MRDGDGPKSDKSGDQESVKLLLAEIESEPVPERLMELALQLQAALRNRS